MSTDDHDELLANGSLQRGGRRKYRIHQHKNGQFYIYERAGAKYQAKYLGTDLDAAITMAARHWGILEDLIVVPETDDERTQRKLRREARAESQAAYAAELAKPKRSVNEISKDIELLLYRQSGITEALRELYFERQGHTVNATHIYCAACGECLVTLPRKLCFRCYQGRGPA